MIKQHPQANGIICNCCALHQAAASLHFQNQGSCLPVQILRVRLQHRPAALNWMAASHLESQLLAPPIKSADVTAAAQGGALSGGPV